MTNEKWLNWAIELQALAQAGLFYGRDVYDIERFQRIRDIAAEMLADRTELPPDTVRGLFCSEIGYQTPKIETRAAVFRDGKILLGAAWRLVRRAGVGAQQYREGGARGGGAGRPRAAHHRGAGQEPA